MTCHLYYFLGPGWEMLASVGSVCYLRRVFVPVFVMGATVAVAVVWYALVARDAVLVYLAAQEIETVAEPVHCLGPVFLVKIGFESSVEA